MASPYPLSHSTNPDDALLNYPRSRASYTSENPVVRSRTWSEDIIKMWNVPISGLESLEERVKRYFVYFSLTNDQLKSILEKFRAEMRCGLQLRKEAPKGQWDASKCSLKMIDAWVTEPSIPRRNVKGTSVSVDFASVDNAKARAVKVTLQGDGKINTNEVGISLRDASVEYPKGLLDASTTASILFDSLATIVKRLIDTQGFSVVDGRKVPVGFSIGHPVEQKAFESAVLMHWTKGYETGRRTNDPIEGMDVAALLDCALWRLKVPAEVRAVANDTVGTLVTGNYEKPPDLPTCRVGFILGAGVNGCYMQPNATEMYGTRGDVINCEVASFDKGLPINDVDLEIDFADESTSGRQLYEKMVSTTYLGELCRRLVVKTWQSEAPQLAWVRQSMPWTACARIAADADENLETTDEILNGLWEWQTTVEQRRTIQHLFHVVFDRSAALAAVAIVALASQTERLQPAMGGLTCAMGGTLCHVPFYFAKLKKYLTVVREDAASLIHLWLVNDGAAKGAGILALMAKSK